MGIAGGLPGTQSGILLTVSNCIVRAILHDQTIKQSLFTERHQGLRQF